MKLVDNAKEALTWFSVQAMALAIALQAAWEVLPAEMKASLPDWGVTTLTAIILISGMFGRIIKQ